MRFLEIIERLQREKQLISDIGRTDYKALKYVDEELTEEEYKQVKEYRQSLREQINKLRGGD